MAAKNKIVILAISIIIFACGCVSTWQAIDKTRTYKRAGFEVMLPSGWVRYVLSSDLLELTKDGILLQYIRFFRYETDEYELPNTKKKFTRNLLLEETAELIVNELSADQEVLGFNLLENTPVLVGGIEAFRLTYTYHTEDELGYRVVLYGFKRGSYIYLIQYRAATQYYFDKDYPTFAEFIDKFKVRK